MMALKQSCSSVSSKKSEDKSHQYWAKGTGFGTGSTTQSWNVEQALCRQRFEEEHVTIFLQVRIDKLQSCTNYLGQCGFFHLNACFTNAIFSMLLSFQVSSYFGVHELTS